MRKHNAVVLGHDSFSGGVFGRVLAAGSMEAENCTMEKLKIAGSARLRDCTVDAAKVAGSLSAANLTCRSLHIAGSVHLQGECTAEMTVRLGSLRAEYLRTGVLRDFPLKKWVQVQDNGEGACEGTVDIGTFEHGLPGTLAAETRCHTIISAAPLTAEKGIGCEALFSFDVLEAAEINGDVVWIRPSRENRVGCIEGGCVIVCGGMPDAGWLPQQHSVTEKQWAKLAGRQDMGIMSVDAIDADSVQVERVKAGRIGGGKVVIGPLCMVDFVEYSESVEISPKAMVGEVIKV